MKTFRRKPHSGRARSESSYEHWLGEGVVGQETLLDDLDPNLYLADSPLCSIITSTALSCDRRGRRPQAILVPDEGTIGWHVGYLAKRYDVAVWTTEDDELINETAYRFNAKTFTGDLAEGADDGCDLVLFTAYGWGSQSELLQAIDEADAILSEGGASAFILPLERDGEAVSIRWTAEEPTLLARITEPADTNRTAPRSVEVLWFEAFNPANSAVVSNFIKRHREYFGKNIRDLVLDRLSGPEFSLNGSNFGIAVVVFSGSE